MAGKGNPKTGGRAKGVPNRDKADLLQQIRERIGDQDFHPVLAMAEMVVATETITDPKTKKQQVVLKYPLSTREAMLREVAQYVAPKLKSVEHTGDAEGFGLNLYMNLGPKTKGNGSTR